MVWTATSGTKPIYNSVRWACLVSLAPKKEKGSTIQYGYMKWETHARVFFRTLAHGNSSNEIRQIKWQTKKVRREAWVWKEVKRGTKERSPDGLSQPNQNTILINIIWYSFKRYGKSTMDLNNRKMTNHPHSPVNDKKNQSVYNLLMIICQFIMASCIWININIMSFRR